MRHDDLENALGAFVLGQLDDPALRAAVEEHLITCDGCRDEVAALAPLAARLASVDPDLAAPPAVRPPPSLDRRVEDLFAPPASEIASVTRLRGPRPSRLVVALAGALAGAAAATGVALVVQPDPGPTGPVVIAVADVGTTAGIEASAGLVDHSWGVEVKLQMEGLEEGQRYAFEVTGTDGTVRPAGQVLGVADTTVTCSMSSPILLADAASFTVTDESGETVVWGEITS